MATQPEPNPVFLSLGMLILDELHLPDGIVKNDVIGGSGAYSTLGARLAVDERDAQKIAIFVLAGDDFPCGKVEEVFRSWGADYVIKRVRGAKSTRGRLVYHDRRYEDKSYEYLSLPLQHTPHDLPSQCLKSTAFHLLSSPDVLSTQVNQLQQLRLEHGISEKALLVWEPAPLSCTANFLDAYIEATRFVDVFSPNHVELLALCGKALTNRVLDHRLVEDCATVFFSAGHQKPKICLVRCGEQGAVVFERSTSASEGRATWVKPFFSPDHAGCVVDATGGGNTFLGAFTVAYQQNGGDAVGAARKASVAASFALEQVGLPTRVDEKWNGTTVGRRVGEYLKMVRNEQ